MWRQVDGELENAAMLALEIPIRRCALLCRIR
jgi:hypothetical protein